MHSWKHKEKRVKLVAFIVSWQTASECRYLMLSCVVISCLMCILSVEDARLFSVGRCARKRTKFKSSSEEPYKWTCSVQKVSWCSVVKGEVLADRSTCPPDYNCAIYSFFSYLSYLFLLFTCVRLSWPHSAFQVTLNCCILSYHIVQSLGTRKNTPTNNLRCTYQCTLGN